MKTIEMYKKYIFLGGGVMAERLYRQLETDERHLIGVMDMLEPEKRVKKEFHGLRIESPDHFIEELSSGDTMLIVAIGTIDVCNLVKLFVEKYGFEENIFVVNPYSTLRFMCINDDFSADERIPLTDSRYQIVKSLFLDKDSNEILKLLTSAKPYDSIYSPYEIIFYSVIKDMYYWSEDYWHSFNFKNGISDGEATVIDCGAYIGDSIIPICNSIPQKKIYYYAFEPEKTNAEQIKKNEYERITENLVVMEYGVGNRDCGLAFKLPDNKDMEGGRFVERDLQEGEMSLEVRRIDGLNLEIHGTVYLKMDIEGFELSALEGASELIKKHRPYMAICIYHRKNDLLEIPLFIQNLVSDYKFFLRGGFHTILWAIPKEKED